jgi:RNA polymerase sigma-70 factor, ECF subfamily
MSDPERIAREERLRREVLRGDEVAWRMWYDESLAELAAFVRWRLGGARDEADEIVQETWLVAVRGIRKFDPAQGSFAGWLRGVAANLIRNHLRKKTKGERSRQPLTADPIATAGDDAERQSDQAERIAAALDALPERYEAVLRAKYLEGLPVETIASQWNETGKAIESVLTRAREAFRRLYQDANHHDGSAEVVHENDL